MDKVRKEQINFKNNMEKTTEHQQSIDILKFVMAFFVVGAHGGFLAEISKVLGYFFCYGIARVSVPIFLLISGFYFYDVKTKPKFINWIKRLFYLYIIWMVIYSPFWFRNNYENAILEIIWGYGQLWYLISSIFAFIFVWLIRNLNLKKQLLILVGCGIVGVLLQYNRSYDVFNSYSLYQFGFNAHRNALFFCFPFIMIGYFINKFSLHKKHINWLFLLILSVCLLLIETFINYSYSGEPFDILLSLYFICPILFIYTLNKKNYSRSRTLALYSTGIYVIHFFILTIFWDIRLLSHTPSLLVIAVFLTSILLTSLLIKIKKKFKYIL
jgi:surface polysaccharide O-acyltransferase-like enzyme